MRGITLSLPLLLAATALSAQTLPLPATELTYAVEYTSKGYLDLTQAASAQEKSSNMSSRTDIRTSLSGTEIVTYLERWGGEGMLASIRFIRPVVEMEINSRPQAQMQQLAVADLTKVIYAYFDRGGRLDHTDFPAGYSSITRNLIAGVLASQQFSLPPGGKLTSAWQSKETGAQSSYQAKYALLPDAGGMKRVTKTIQALSGVQKEDAGPESGQKIVPSGKADFTLEPGGPMKELRGSLHESVFVRNRLSGANDLTLHLRLVTRKQLPDSELRSGLATFQSVKGSLSSAAVANARDVSEGQVSVQRQILGQDTAATIQTALAALDRQTVNNDQRNKVYLKLKALLFLQPAQAAAFQKLLVEADFSKSSASVVAGAMAAAGTPEAQAALCAAVEAHRKDGGVLQALIPELGSAVNPSEKLVSFLMDFSKKVTVDEGRAAALIALGSLGGTLGKSAPQQADRIAQELSTRWSPMKDRAIVLLALGNTRSQKAEKFILAQQADPSSVIRRAVATSLSIFGSTASDAALCNYVKSDADPSVRAAAAQSLAPRHAVAAVRDVLLNSVQQDKMDTVRIAGLFALAPAIPSDKQVRDVVTKLSKSATSQPVKEQAAKLLEQAANPSPISR